MLSSTSNVRDGAHGQGRRHPALLAPSQAGQPVLHGDPLHALPSVCRRSRAGAAEVMGELLGTEEDRPPSPAAPEPARVHPRLVPLCTPSLLSPGTGRSPWAFTHSAAHFPLTAVHGTPVWVCAQAVSAAILLWGLLLEHQTGGLAQPPVWHVLRTCAATYTDAPPPYSGHRLEDLPEISMNQKRLQTQYVTSPGPRCPAQWVRARALPEDAKAGPTALLIPQLPGSHPRSLCFPTRILVGARASWGPEDSGGHTAGGKAPDT